METDPIPVGAQGERSPLRSERKLSQLSAEIIHRRRSTSMSDDYSVQKTNDDAAESKCVAVKLGYWTDDFLQHLYVLPHDHNSRRDPEINRGYWARVTAIRALVDKFLVAAGPFCQIVNIGAGFDTLYWRLKQDGAQFAKFIDVDFSSVTSKKIRQIRKAGDKLIEWFPVPPKEEQHADLYAGDYCLIGADLRQEHEFRSKLESAGVDFKMPTLFVCECVLVYMHVCKSHELLRTLAKWFDTAVFINYEQVHLNDTFGEVMQQNLEQRGIILEGLAACESLNTQKQRFLDANWQKAAVWSMWEIYDKILPKAECRRIEKIEFLDEVELLSQLLEHYCLVVAFKSSPPSSVSFDDLIFK